MTSRIDQVAEDVTELKVMVGKVITTMEFHQQQVNKLDQQMSTALIPIQFAKWAAALMGGTSVAVGLVYGLVQVAHAVSAVAGH